MYYPRVIENLINQLSRLPGIGTRSAERIVFHLLKQPRQEAGELSQAIDRLKDNMMFCRICNHLSETDLCMICSDSSRDDHVVCVVENPKDVLAIERTGVYRGLYHVLLGAISLAEGRGPDDLKINRLAKRIKENNIREVIIATDPDTEGETTALFLAKELAGLPVKITRIGFGIPLGSSLEYSDLSTLGISLTARRDISQDIPA